MKTKIIILMMHIAFIKMNAQFTEVVDVDTTLTKHALFNNAIEWLTITYKSANDVIQMKDDESGKIIAKGNLNTVPLVLGRPYPGHTTITITISCKNGKYKYEFSNITFVHQQGYNISYIDDPRTKQEKRWKEQCTEEVHHMINNLKKSIIKKDEF